MNLYERTVKRLHRWLLSSALLGTVSVFGCTAVSAAPYNVNIIINPGAESDLAGWIPSGAFETLPYGTSGGFPGAGSPGPSDRGERFFSGGPNNAASSATQSISLADNASDIDLGVIAFELSGYFGGFASQNDWAALTVSFRDAGGTSLLSETIGNVTASDRGNITGLLFRETSGFVPAFTRDVLLTLNMTRVSGIYNDGYADNLSLVLSSPQMVSEPETVVVLAMGLMALGWARINRKVPPAGSA